MNAAPGADALIIIKRFAGRLYAYLLCNEGLQICLTCDECRDLTELININRKYVQLIQDSGKNTDSGWLQIRLYERVRITDLSDVFLTND